MGKRSLSVGQITYDRLVDYCSKYHMPFQRFTEEAILEKLKRDNPSDKYVRFMLHDKNFERQKTLQEIIVKMTKFVNFFGTYADGNLEEMRKALGDDEETCDLLEKVFDSGKEASKSVKGDLKEALLLLRELRKDDRLAKAREELRAIALRKKTS